MMGFGHVVARSGCHSDAPKVKRGPPCISTATGGPMSGIDLTDSSGLQETDDLEFVERMKQFK
jgi:hypothetical protein